MIQNVTGWRPIFKRELRSYFTTPAGYIFLIIFLAMQGVFTFYLGNFFERGQADLTAFFLYQPWIYLFLVPAISMRLWSEEIRTGTIELVLTLPVTTSGAILGKFLAAQTFTTIAILLTFPVWLTVNYLGSPDNGVILVSYIGSIFVAASFMAIGMAMSIYTSNQTLAYVMSLAMGFIFVVAGLPIVLDAAGTVLPDTVLLAIANLSLLTHFNDIQRGVLSMHSVLYFLSLIALWLWVARVGLNKTREES